MKMRECFVGLQRMLMIAPAVFYFESALAGSPIPFDDYTVNNGAVSAGCPNAASLGTGATAVTCTDGVSDNGMLQREVTITGGVMAGKYIQFIVTDPGVSGDAQAIPFSSGRGSLNFANEDFVKMNNRGDGISSKQTLIDSSMTSPVLEQRFVNTHEYDFGWANSGSTPWIHSYQDISTVDYSDPLNPTETFSSAVDVINNGGAFVPGSQIDIGIDQYVDLTDPNGSGAQQFKYKKVGGQYQTTSNPANPVLPGGTNGGNVTWSPFQTVSALWVGQNILSSGLASSGLFSHTAFQNLNSGSTSSLTRLDTNFPTNWSNPPFGPTNAIVPPHIVAATAAYTAPTGLTATVAAGSNTGPAPVTASVAVSYDNWTVSNGTFTPGPCPASMSCGAVIVNERGLFQRIVTIGSVEYVQTIITDPTASGDPNAAPFTTGALAFKNETYVKYRDPTGSPTGTGIATTMHIDQQDLAYRTADPSLTPLPTTGGQFTYDTKIENGWANGGGMNPTITVDQRVFVPDTKAQQTTSMDNSFHMEIGQTQSDKIIDISSVVGTSAQGYLPPQTILLNPTLCPQALPAYQQTDPNAYCDVTGTLHFQDWGNGFINPIMFRTSIAQGAFQNTNHSLADPVLLPSNGGNIAWGAGDAIQATWVAGSYLTTDPNGPSLVGSTSYTNLSTGARTAFTSTNADPFMTNTPPPYGTTVSSGGTVGPDSWVSPFDTIGTGAPVYTSTYVAPAF